MVRLLVELNYFGVLCLEVMCFFRGFLYKQENNGNKIIISEKFSLEYDQLELIYSDIDIEKLNGLTNSIKRNKDIFHPAYQYDFKNLIFQFFNFNYKLIKKSNFILIQVTESINYSMHDGFIYTLLYRLPILEFRIYKKVADVINAFKANQSLINLEDYIEKEDFFDIINNLILYSRRHGFRRYYGYNYNFKKWPPYLSLRCLFPVIKTFRTTIISFQHLPLVSKFPSYKSKCSWDYKGKEIINSIIPNKRIQKMIDMLKIGKFFGLKIGFLYSKKVKLIYDFWAFLVLILIFKILYLLIKNSDGAAWTIISSILTGFMIIIAGKAVLDIRYWSRWYDNILHTLTKK